jgi:hypothetical protein
MAASINFANVPRTTGVNISVANTNRDGTGTLGTLITAGVNGTRIDRIRIQATANTTAGMVRLFLYDGSTFFPLQEQVVGAVTVAAGTAGFNAEISFGDTRPLQLPAGWDIQAGTHNAEAFTVTAYGADY